MLFFLSAVTRAAERGLSLEVTKASVTNTMQTHVSVLGFSELGVLLLLFKLLFSSSNRSPNEEFKL